LHRRFRVSPLILTRSQLSNRRKPDQRSADRGTASSARIGFSKSFRLHHHEHAKSFVLVTAQFALPKVFVCVKDFNRPETVGPKMCDHTCPVWRGSHSRPRKTIRPGAQSAGAPRRTCVLVTSAASAGPVDAFNPVRSDGHHCVVGDRLTSPPIGAVGNTKG
jgi:hypothetical protein